MTPQHVLDRQISNPQHCYLLLDGKPLSHSCEDSGGKLVSSGVPVRFTRLAAERVAGRLGRLCRVVVQEIAVISVWPDGSGIAVVTGGIGNAVM